MKPSSKKFYNTVLEGLDLPVKPVKRDGYDCFEVGSVVPEHVFPLGLLGPLRPLWRPRWWVWFKGALIDNIIKIKNYLLLGIRNVRGE